MDDPLALFNAAVAALNDEQWLMAARLCDPVSLSRFRRQQLDQLAPTAPWHDVTAEEMMKYQPGLSRELAGFQAQVHRDHTRPEFLLKQGFPMLPSVEMLAALGPAELFAAWLEGQSPRRQLKRLIERGLAPPEIAEHLDDMNSPRKYALLGVISEGESAAYILYREDLGDESAMWDGEVGEHVRKLPEGERELEQFLASRAQPRTAVCRRQADGSWKLLAGHQFLGSVPDRLRRSPWLAANTVIVHTETHEE